MSLSALANKFYELREKKTELNNQVKDLQTELNAVEQDLFEEMGHEGMSRIDVQGKGSFYIANRRFYKINDRDVLMDFLHEQGDTDILTVQHQTLNAYAKEICTRKEAEGITDYIIPGVEYTTKTHIRIRKSRNG